MNYGGWANLWALLAGFALGILLCGTGHAEERAHICSVFDATSGLLKEHAVPCDEAWRIRTDAEPPCLAQMEAAMRAMEPFTMVWYMPDMTLRVPADRRQAALEAVVLWESTKRECWRQP